VTTEQDVAAPTTSPGLGFPRPSTAAASPLGWPTVSRETSSDPAPPGATPTGADRPAPAPVSPPVSSEDVTITEPSQPQSPLTSPETLEAPPTQDTQVSRETSLDPVVPAVADDEPPLARAVADEARRRAALASRELSRPDRTRILTVANQKGGVGKTTTTVNVAAALAQSGAAVLVIDLDPQGNASTALGVPHHPETTSIYDVLIEDVPLADVIADCPDVPGLRCAPATIDLAGAEIELISLVARETRLRRAVAAYVERLAAQGERLDYIFVDCPPSLGLLTINAFVAADEVFIPIQCEYYALEGLSQLLKTIELIRSHLNPGLHVSSILLTMYDARTRLSAQVAEEVREHFPAETLRTSVPRSVRISEAPSYGQTVITYDPSSTGALSYLEAAGELADRGVTGATPQNKEQA